MKGKIKEFFKRCFDKKIKRAYFFTILATLMVFVLGTLFENNQWINNMYLSKYMAECFSKHQNNIFSLGYVIYYTVFYIVIIPIYIVPSLIFLIKERENDWYGFVIFLSIVFLFLSNAYLSEMLMYENDGGSMNQTYITACTCVATAIIATAGIKIGMKKNSEEDNKK